MTRLLVPVALVALLLSGCASSSPATSDGPTVAQLQARIDSLERRAHLRHPNLNSVLWTQTAVEFDGVTRSAYQAAHLMMTRALHDSSWTAALEQRRRGVERYRSLPPAVVLDVDETVLDNSAYQARLIRQNETYDSESWNAWCRERAAGAIPGALAFTQAAARAGVQVIYLTNRDHRVEAATRDNLRQLGFPLSDTSDVILTQGERPGWEEKGPRRAFVADRYRVLLLIGDNAGDFISNVEQSVPARRRLAEQYQGFWGTRWIVLPNPQYGSWEGALFDYNYGLPYLERLQKKHKALRTKSSN
ncbi:5'-nucleotidase, lipoprotein e(P4) family [Salisaeta longa]|uniref:5'-nucleotidase, lipoprotein e(P4) family n=1 Tax=Salisaeta longa TaxID=503170 RepID=UPI0003B2E44E|nr:HAD family acid phosphatase [Salisaeta longa]